MARPKKAGLDYFPFDCDFFEDEKIVAIAGEFGFKGELATIKLLCAIYRNGYFIEWSEMLRYKLLRRLPVSAECLDQIVNRLVKWGFFDASLFDSVKVLTSVGIQRRYFSIIRKRVGSENYPYLLVSAPETPVSASETPVSASETPQSKVNKSKIKKSPNGDKKRARSPADSGLFSQRQMKKLEARGVKAYQLSSFTPPTPEEVRVYFQQQKADLRLPDWENEALLFFNYYNSQNWLRSNGNQVSSWESVATEWIVSKEIKFKQNERLSTNRRAASEDTLADEQYKLAERIKTRRNRQNLS